MVPISLTWRRLLHVGHVTWIGTGDSISGSTTSAVDFLFLYNTINIINNTAIIAAINETGIGITTLFTIELPDVQKQDLVVHLDKDDCRPAIAEIQRSGYRVRERSR